MSSGTFLGCRDKDGNEMHCAHAKCISPAACVGGCKSRVAKPKAAPSETKLADDIEQQVDAILGYCREVGNMPHSLSESLAGTIINNSEVILAALRRPMSAGAVTEQDWNVGKWLSAALEDDAVCAEMKADINVWFNSKGPWVTPRDGWPASPPSVMSVGETTPIWPKHDPLLKITVTGDCPVTHQSFEEWQQCAECKRIGDLKRRGLWREPAIATEIRARTISASMSLGDGDVSEHAYPVDTHRLQGWRVG